MTPSVMEAGGIEETESESEVHLKELIQEQQTSSHVTHEHEHDNEHGHQINGPEEQSQFNHLSKDHKLDRLNNLIQKSQLYSQIIADNILQSSLLKRQQKEQQQQPTPDETPTKKKRKTARSSRSQKTKVQHDITSMLSTKISDTTKSAKQAIEVSQDATTSATIQQPRLISGATLKNYQLDGLEWLITLYENGLNGILADEMGLGKTLQCIAFLSFLIENGIQGPFLIVVPLSTLTNWENEFKKFAPKVSIFKYGGSKQDRGKISLNHEINHRKLNIVLTSYEISIKDFNKLNSINWNYLIVDEGHRLKNNNCVLIKFLKKLNTTNRLLLTGTPLQNNLNELWSLLNFILPDIFHDLELFQQWFNFDELTHLADDIEDDENDGETKRLIKLNIQQNLIKNLHTILKPFLLRRLKRDVIKDLPPKKEYIIHIPLSKLQTKLYYDCINNRLYYSLVEINLKDFIKYNHFELFKGNFDIIDQFLALKFGKEIDTTEKSAKLIKNYREFESDDEFEDFSNDPNDGEDEGTHETYESIISNRKRISKREKQQLILSTLFTKINKEVRNLSLQNLTMQLRNICNSPYIYYEPFLINHNEANNHESKFMKILLQNSSKFQVLDQLIESLLQKDHKILIFSQFTKVLDLIQDWLNFRHIEICRLDGSTSQPNRDEEIKKFNNNTLNYKVFLLSTRAGGLGINLVAADSVILFDNDWNPQMDLQAIDRVHRIGQVKPVKIFRFLIMNSIEEILITKSSSKRFLEKLVINLGEFRFNKLKSLIDNNSNNPSGNNENISVKDLLEFSKMNFKVNDEVQGEGEDEEIKQMVGNQIDYDFNAHQLTDKQIELLNEQEMDELMDRSINCYQSIDDSRFKHISIFETVNNMDKED